MQHSSTNSSPLPYFEIENSSWKRSYYLLLQYHTQQAAIFYCAEDELSLRILLHSGRDPSACKNLALRRACEYGLPNVLRLLLADKRVDPSSLTDLLTLAPHQRRVDIVALLLEDGTELHSAPSYRTVELS